jgi:ribosomal protein S5
VTQVAIEEAVAQAKREFLPVKGIVAVSWMNRTIVFYVETPQDAAKVPPSYYGYPTMVKITGPIVTLK